MKKYLATLALGALAWTALAAPAWAQSQSTMPGAAASAFTGQQRQEIVDIVRAALKTDPSILRDAVAALQQEEGHRQDVAARAAIGGMSDALLHGQGDPIAGNPNGDVTVVEFYDVRCPYCRRMLPVLADVLKRDHAVRIVYKDIPILGPGSLVAARAVLAAQRQGGYQKLHDALMAGTPTIDREVVHGAASKLGLDWERLQRDMDDPAIQARIDANLQLAHTLQIEGTPAYVIGAQMLPGAVDLAELQGAVAAARKH
jgi:protein-disulfide isomerase